MTIHETYLANIGNFIEKNQEISVVIVTRNANHPLSPTWNLINEWKGKKIDWREYTKRYLNEIINKKEAINSLYRIAGISLVRDVCIVCYEKHPPCHRFILLSVFKYLGYDVDNSYKDDSSVVESDIIVKEVLDDLKLMEKKK